MGWGRSAGKRAHVSVRLESDRHDTQSVPLIWRGTSADTSPQSAKALGSRRGASWGVRHGDALPGRPHFVCDLKLQVEWERRRARHLDHFWILCRCWNSAGESSSASTDCRSFTGMWTVPPPGACVSGWGANRRACKFTGMWRLQIGWIWHTWRTHAQEASN